MRPLVFAIALAVAWPAAANEPQALPRRGEPAKVYRTLQQAHEAGVNPLAPAAASVRFQPQPSTAVPAPRWGWQALAVAGALLPVATVTLLWTLSRRRR